VHIFQSKEAKMTGSKILLTIAIAFVLTAGMTIIAIAQDEQPLTIDDIWADGTLYETSCTQSNSGNDAPTDSLFLYRGLNGQHAVAKAEPGDNKYHGGNWQVVYLDFTDAGKKVHDPDGDGYVNFEIKNWDEARHHIGLGHMTVAGSGPIYSCPLSKDNK
jgi:hypothetical protein